VTLDPTAKLFLEKAERALVRPGHFPAKHGEALNVVQAVASRAMSPRRDDSRSLL
jgi:hypothetical protein